MESKIARVITYLLHPLFMPTFIFIFLLHQDYYFALMVPEKAKWMVIGLVFLTTALIPVIANYFFLKKGLIRSFAMESREERLYPFLVTCLAFYLSAWMIKSLQIPGIFYLFSLGACMLVIITLFINFFMKISIHMVGIGGALGTILGMDLRWQLNFTNYFLITLVLAGCVGFARLKLNIHRPVEIYSGFLLGLLAMTALFVAV